MDEKTNDWHTEKQLVHHLLKEYGDQLKALSNKLNDLDKKIEILNTKVLLGASLMSFIVSIVMKMFPLGGQ